MLTKKNIQDIYQLSPMQEGIYFHATMDDRSQAYFSQMAYQVSGSLEPSLIEESLNILVQRHDILRTVFNHKNADEIIQIVLKERKADFQFLDIRKLSAEAKTLYLNNFKEEDRQRNFNLNKDLLIRVAVIQLEDQQYELLWSIHHIIMDGWCQNILLEEFQQIYYSLLYETAVDLPPTCQYKTYIDWLKKQDASKSAAHWNAYLKGYEEKRSLFRPKKVVEDVYDNREIELLLSTELSDQLRQIALDHQLTLGVVLQAAWGVLLSKYYCTQDILFGLVRSVRPAEIQHVERAIGVFINTLPVRISYKEGDSFLDILRKLKAQQADAEPHTYLPLSRIQRESERKQQLLDHAFIFENLPDVAAEDAEEELDTKIPQVRFKESFDQTNYHFNVIVEPNTRINFKWNFNAAVVSPDVVAELSSHFERLLEQIPRKSKHPVEQLRLMDTEAAAALIGLNPERTVFEGSKTTIAHYYRQLLNNPDGMALIGDNVAWTYRDLLQEVQRIANSIQKLPNFQSGRYIATYLDRSPQAVAALFAIWELGCIYVPIDTAQPKGRIQFILEDTKPLCVVCTEKRAALIRDLYHQPITLEACQKDDGQVGPVENVQPTDIAYVIYTSGTSGQPKGVPIRHESIANQILYHNEYLGLGAEDRILHMASLAFDASLVEILMAVFAGATIVVTPQSIKENTEKISDWLRQNRVTTAIFPPAYLQLLEEVSNSALKRIISTGEAIIAADALRYSLEMEIYNGYGPTECCIGATFHKVDPTRQHEYTKAGGIPIGKPFANSAVYILNQHGELLPKGMVGEIYVAGVGLSKGYLNQVNLTNEKFVANPYARYEQENVMYRTGDLGSWNENGEIEFHGRADDQVQLRGIRVEPKEIEACIRQLPSVRRAVVCQVPIQKERILTAFIESDQQLHDTEIKSHLKDHLPAYMIPACILFVDQFELTANGKVDRKVLQRLAIESAATTIESSHPESSEEVLLCKIMEEVLKGQSVTPTADFFLLGGDSIKAIQLVSRLYRKGYSLEVKDVFNYPIIRQMARRICQVKSLAEQGVVKGRLPLTPIQCEFFSLELQHPEQFNHAAMFRSEKSLEEQKVREILQKLLDHHDALRTAFYQYDDGALEAEIRDASVSTRLICFDLTEEEKPEERRAELCQVIQKSFRLEQPPLFSAALFQAADGDRLFIAIHHLVFDGISWRIFEEDLQTLFYQMEQGAALELPPKTDSYLLWSQELLRKAKSHSFHDEFNYWASGAFKDAVNIPTSDTGEKGIDSVSFTLSDGYTELLQTKANRAFGSETRHLLLAALGQAAREIWDCEKLQLMMEGHGREEIIEGLNTSRTIGWFTNLYPVALPCFVDRGQIGRLIQAVKDTLGSIPHNGIGFGMAKYLREETTDLPTPNLLFNYLGQFDTTEEGDSPLKLVDEDMGDSMNPNEKPPFGLSINALIEAGCLQVELQYDKAKYDSREVEVIANIYYASLESVIDYCSLQTPQHHSKQALTYQKLSEQEWQQLQTQAKEAGGFIQDVYPLSPMQETMFFQALMHPESTAYFYQLHYLIEGNIDLQLLEKSLNRLIERHDILRTIFLDKVAERNLQLVLQELTCPVNYIDLRGLNAADQQNKVEAFLEEDQQNLFDLGKGPLLRLALIQLDDTTFKMVWSSHHILMDGWCFEVLVGEFSEIYQRLSEGTTAKLPFAHQYCEYIQWLEAQQHGAAETYWEQYLNGYDKLASLVQRKKQPETQNAFELKRNSLQLDAKRSKQLYQICQQWRITPSIFLQTAWGITLGRYNNRRDVVFGKTVSGRPPEVEGIETMAGLFVNTLPVRVQTKSGQTFREVARLQQIEFLDSQAYQYCPYTKIVAQSELQQSLLDHSFVVQNLKVETEADQNADLDWEIKAVDAAEHANFDLCVIAYTQEEIRIDLEYNGLVYQEWYIEQITSQLELLIQQAIAEEEKTLGQLPLQTIQESSTLQIVNDSQRAFPNETVLDLLQQQVATHPDLPAVKFQSTQWTYKELEAYSNQIAHYLIQNFEVGKGQIVALRVDRSEQALALLLGVLKTGASYLVIDKSFPPKRVAFILEDSRANVLLYDQGAVESSHCRIVATSDIELDDLPQTRPDVHITSADIMYTIYTSGSTGQPKGVQIRHASLFNYIYHNFVKYDITSEDRTVLMSSMAYDLGYTSLWTPFTSGGLQVVLPESDFLDTNELMDVLINDRITILKLTPTTFSLLVNDPKFATLASELSLRLIVLGGEKIRMEDLYAYREVAEREVIFVDEYGPTEATIGVTQYDLDTEKLEAIRSVQLEGTNVGKPISNAQIYILDEEGREAGIGMIGELHIGGAGLASAYLNRPQLTAERFIIHPTEPPQRLYRSGDLARWMPGGEIEYIGRKDHQLKVRGYRVELEEVEAVIRQQEGVRDVVILSEQAEDVTITAYLILENGHSTDALRNQLEEAIPAYMIPHLLLELEAFPQLANGKVDRSALKALRTAGSETSGTTDRELSDKEKILIEAFEKVMRISPISLDDNFFNMGGDSIRAMRIIAYLYKEGYQLEIKDIFLYPVLSEMEAYLSTLDESTAAADAAFMDDDAGFADEIDGEEIDLINQLINN